MFPLSGHIQQTPNFHLNWNCPSNCPATNATWEELLLWISIMLLDQLYDITLCKKQSYNYAHTVCRWPPTSHLGGAVPVNSYDVSRHEQWIKVCLPLVAHCVSAKSPKLSPGGMHSLLIKPGQVHLPLLHMPRMLYFRMDWVIIRCHSTAQMTSRR